MKRRLLLILVLTMSLLMVSVPGSASSEKRATILQARNAAMVHVTTDAKTEKTGWKGQKVHLSKPVDLYDPTGTLVAYLFAVTTDGNPTGYVVVGTDLDEYPIYEFSYNAEAFAPASLEAIKSRSSREIKSYRHAYLGPHHFAIDAVYSDGSTALVELSSGREIQRGQTSTSAESNHAAQARQTWAEINTITPAPCDETKLPKNGDNDGVTLCPDNYETTADGFAYNTISGVPAWDQWVYYSTFNDPNNPGQETRYWVGCTPTAAGDIMGYWQFHGYPNMGHSQMVIDLREAMSTSNTHYDSTCKCYPGATADGNVASGMTSYARGRGYPNATATLVTSPSFSAMKTEVDSLHPAELLFHGQTYYGSHATTLVGYREYFYTGNSAGHQYMTIHDNWSTTPNEIYVAYGRNYTSVLMVKFRPE